MFCVKCGASLPDGTQSCPQCGAPMDLQPVQQPRTQRPRIPEPPISEEEIYLPMTRKRKVSLPAVIVCVLLALLAAAVCAVLFVRPLHDAVFGVPELAFAQEQLSLSVGSQQNLTAEMDLGSRSSGDLRWTSSAPEIASVQDGIVTASGVGVCTITVVDPTREDAYDTLLVTVTEAQPDSAAAASQPDAAEGETQPVDGSSEAQIADNIDVDAELQQIRSWYYTPGATDVRREIGAGTNGWKYSREYLYHDGVMVFAYVYGGGEEHRLYFKDGKLFFVIETDRSEYRLEAAAPFLPMAEQAKSDALNFAP